LDVVGKCKCSVPDVQSHNVEAPFEEFRGCPQHGQVTASSRAETGMAAEIRRRYADMLEVCRTGALDTDELENCNLELYLLRHW